LVDSENWNAQEVGGKEKFVNDYYENPFENMLEIKIKMMSQ